MATPFFESTKRFVLLGVAPRSVGFEVNRQLRVVASERFLHHHAVEGAKEQGARDQAGGQQRQQTGDQQNQSEFGAQR